MAIKAIPTISSKIFLRNLNDDVRKLEGEDCQEADWAWVIVRQATEEDNMRRADLRKDSVVEWVTEEGSDSVGVKEYRQFNQRKAWALEVYMTLVDAGNLFADDAGVVPLFEFENAVPTRKLKHTLAEFEKLYGRLPSSVAGSILAAVHSVNLDWALLRLPTNEGEA